MLIGTLGKRVFWIRIYCSASERARFSSNYRSPEDVQRARIADPKTGIFDGFIPETSESRMRKVDQFSKQRVGRVEFLAKGSSRSSD